MAQPLAQLVFLAFGELPVVVAAEDLAKGRQVTQQCAALVDELHQAPQLGQVVLNGRRGQQQHRRVVLHQHVVQAAGGAGERRGHVVDTQAVEALVQASEDLVRFVDDAQVEGAASSSAAWPDCEPAPSRLMMKTPSPSKPPGAGRASCTERLDGGPQLLSPLADQRLRRHQQHPTRAFGEHLRDDEPGLDGFP